MAKKSTAELRMHIALTKDQWKVLERLRVRLEAKLGVSVSRSEVMRTSMIQRAETEGLA
jgi:hypothetical protein